MHNQHGYRRLNRDKDHRRALLMNLATSLLRHEAIKTTEPKAKEVRRYAEKLITKSKKDTTQNRRIIFAQIRDTEVIDKLFAELGPRYLTRPGGYTRLIKLNSRPGDNAPMALVELVDRPEKKVEPEPAPKGKKAPAAEGEAKAEETK